MKKITNALLVCGLLMVACMFPCKDIKAQNIGKYELSESGSNRKYDVTGDGALDTVEFKKSAYTEYNSYTKFQVVINGETALSRQGTDIAYYEIKPTFIQTKEHSYFLITLLQQDYGRDSRIYEYVDGKLEQRSDLNTLLDKVFFIYNVSISSVEENTFTWKVDGETDMLAITKMSFVYNIKSTGALSLGKKVVKVSYSNKRLKMVYPYGTYKSKYLVATKKAKVYRSDTGKKKAFRIKKGTKLKITKISIRGKVPRYYCVTQSGKRGWLKSEYGLFKNLIHTQ